MLKKSNAIFNLSTVFIVDIVHESNALKEARKLGVPTVAMVDTNADPSLVSYPIPINDDAIKTIQLVVDYAKRAITAGRSNAKSNDSKKEPASKAE